MKKQYSPIVTLPIAGCQVITPPVIKPFADNKSFMLVEELVYVLGGTDIAVTAPKGCVSDFASVPRALWSLGWSLQRSGDIADIPLSGSSEMVHPPVKTDAYRPLQVP